MPRAIIDDRSAVRTVEPEAHLVADDGTFPNDARLPVLVYQAAFTLPEHVDLAAVIEDVFQANVWPDGWRNGVLSAPHYHSTAHEVLGCYGGRARLRLGGSGGVEVDIARGDVVVIPAGVAHQSLGSSSDFAVVGSYPEGQDFDMMYGRPGERPAADQRIAAVPLPGSDPLYGPEGPLTQRWG